MTFGEKLALLRRQAAMSQEELADKLAVSRQAISRWELGSSLPETQKILQISRVFDVSCDYLLKDDMEQDGSPQMPAPPPAAVGGHSRTARFLALAGGIGALAFWILSAVYPAETWSSVAGQSGVTVKTGLLGFLDYHDMGLLFALCCLALAAGLGIYAYNYIKNKKTV